MTDLPLKTTKLATQSTAAPLRREVLLGTFGSAEHPRALLRFADGQIETLAPNDETRLGLVMAIDTGRIILRKDQRERVIEMPAPG